MSLPLRCAGSERPMGTAMSKETVRIFVGCDPNNCDLEQMMVLDYSVHKHARQPVVITWMQLSHDPHSAWYSDQETGSGWHTEHWATPFSGFRWAIPESCNFEGRAIYMDADVIVLCDVAELWSHPMHAEATVAAKGGTVRHACVPAYGIARRPDPICRRSRRFGPTRTVQEADAADQTKTAADSALPRFIQQHRWRRSADRAHQDPALFRHGDAVQPQVLAAPPRGRRPETLVRRQDHAASATGPCRAVRPVLSGSPGRRISPENYAVQPFGAFSKATQKNYRGNKVTRPPTKANLLEAAIGSLKNKLRSSPKFTLDD